MTECARVLLSCLTMRADRGSALARLGCEAENRLDVFRFLRMVCEPVFVGDIRERQNLLAASMTVDSAAEIKQLFARYQEAGVDFYQTLRQEPWGASTFIVRDPDGNLLLFAGPAR